VVRRLRTLALRIARFYLYSIRKRGPTHALAHEMHAERFEFQVGHILRLTSSRFAGSALWPAKKKGRPQSLPFFKPIFVSPPQPFGVHAVVTNCASKAGGTCLKQA